MRKNIFFIALLVLFIFILTSCKADKNNDTVHIWMYDGEYISSMHNSLSKVENYCSDNEIPLEIHYYTDDEMTDDDYVLKRNASLNNPNNIVWGGANEMCSLPSEHANYIKIDNYKNVGEGFRCLSYIPCSYIGKIDLVDINLLNYYDITIEKDMLSYPEYRSIVFEMIEKGAEFNNEYVINKMYIEEKAAKYMLPLNIVELGKNINDEYEENLINAIKEVAQEKVFNYECVNQRSSKRLIDLKTNLYLTVAESIDMDLWNVPYNGEPGIMKTVDSISDTIMIFKPLYITNSVFVAENVKNEKVYDVVNYILSTECIKNRCYEAEDSVQIYTLKNDVSDELYVILNGESLLEFKENNKEDLDRIEKIINSNIKNGNLSQEYVELLQFDVLFNTPNSSLYEFISNESNKLMNGNISDDELKKDVDNFIAKLKLRF
ncbi:hypothetical protein JYG23_09680 [Sedimentibacter sp. zth1]|uniref:hypothetical protein n=1 Tax=Sedimentibacter sp. zth1 TaxID=2816908 RepID=UPI001A9164CA|nr:hypothetical protein [Sedimentibacter sp. zth1]QSX04959.1 hypothetical protein JYG23_09680 [Sedimentibacter sp. zth1]